MKRKMMLILVLVVSISMVAVFSLTGCKEATPVEEEAVKEVTEEAVEEEAAEETQVEEEVTEEAEEEIELGKEPTNYWIDKAGIVPSGDLVIYSYKEENCTEGLIAQKFADAYPDVNVEWITIPGSDYVPKIVMELETGTQDFDLLYVNDSYMKLFADSLLDVTDRIPEELRNDIIPGIQSTTVIDDVWYGIPLFTSVFGMAFNKQHMADAGYSTIPETWDEFFQAAADTTTDKDGDGIPEVFGYTGACGQWAYHYLYDNILPTVGGSYWNGDSANPVAEFNNEAGLRAMEIMKKLLMSDFSDPAMATKEFNVCNQSMASGQVAMEWYAIGATQAIINADFPENKDMLGWGPVPHDPGFESYALNGSLGFAVADGDNSDTALAYMLFYSSPEMQKFFVSEYGFVPNRISLKDDADFVSKFPYIPGAIEAAENSVRYTGANEDDLAVKYAPLIERYFDDTITAQELLDEMETIFYESWAELNE